MTLRRGCSGSLSRGLAPMRIVLGVAAIAVLAALFLYLFPSRETRFLRFFDAARTAFVERREEAFLAAFDPAVKYQGTFGTAEIRRDFRRYHSAGGLGAPEIVKQELALDPEGADLTLDVVVVAGLTPVARASVRMRALEVDGEWRVTSVSWQ
jgi:hypothetical protein